MRREARGMPLTFQLKIIPMLRRDFLLFENQIPLFILETILESTKHDIAGKVTILDLALGYLYEGKIKKEMLLGTETFNSLLHLSYYCLVNQQKLLDSNQKTEATIASALAFEDSNPSLYQNFGRGIICFC